MSKLVANYNQTGCINIDHIRRLFIEPTEILGGKPEPKFALRADDDLSACYERFNSVLLGIFETEEDAKREMNKLATLT